MKIKPAKDGKHKWIAEFKDGTRTKFGAKGMDDYTVTHDKAQRARYLTRHHKDLKTRNPKKPGFLSYYLLWGPHTSIKANVRNYKKMFKSV
jgi:hypothetical protein